MSFPEIIVDVTDTAVTSSRPLSINITGERQIEDAAVRDNVTD